MANDKRLETPADVAGEMRKCADAADTSIWDDERIAGLVENEARKRQAMKKYRASAKGRAWRMAWNAKNADRVKATNRRSEAKRKVKKQTDAAYYAKRRADVRKRHAKAAMIAKGSYRPRYSERIPDWCVMGGAVDIRSSFLFENATASDRAFARDLAIERRAQ